VYKRQKQRSDHAEDHFIFHFVSPFLNWLPQRRAHGRFRLSKVELSIYGTPHMGAA
jgi:hypothetical protein